MAKKNEKTFEEVLETEGAVVTTLAEVLEAVDETTDERTQFINDNIEYVPNARKNVFKTWDIDKQYEMLVRWKHNYEWRKQWEEANKIENRVKELFIKRKVTLDEVLKVIEFCNDWIKDEREKQIIALDEEIARLEERRNTLASC